MLRNSLHATAAAAAVALSLTACGGGGGNTSALPTTTAPTNTQPSAQTAQASMTIKIPARAATSSVKSQYISASTKSMTIGLLSNGKTTQIAEVDLTPTSPSCSAITGGGLQCNVTFVGQAGTNTYALSMYDQAGGKGNMLSTGNVAATLTAGKNTNVAIALDGVPVSAAVVLGTGTLPVGNVGTTSVIVEALDSGNNVIVGPGSYSTPVTLAISGDTHKTLTLSSASVTQSGQAVTLSYNGGSNVGSTITPSIGNAAFASGAAKFNGTGGSLTMHQWADSTDGFYNPVPVDVAAYPSDPNGTAAILFTQQTCCWSYSYALANVNANGVQNAFIGDTTDPYNVPSPGTVTATNVTVVNGMSKLLRTWGYNTSTWNMQNSTIAAGPVGQVYYGGQFSSTSAPTCSGGTLISGTIGLLNMTQKTTVERVLKGSLMYVTSDKNGNAWFIESTGTCSTSGNLLPSGYGIGELTASGSLSETDFASAGLPSNINPTSMAINSDASLMYVGDSANQTITSLVLPGVSGPVAAHLTNSYDPYALAVAPDGTTLWFSYDDPDNNYYYGYVPGSKTFGSTNVQEAAFPITYFYSSSAAYADGSFWIAGTQYQTGIGRLSNLSTSSPLAGYYAMPNPDGYGQELSSISVGNGVIWASDYNYGNIDIFQYGAPSTGNVTFSVRRASATSGRKANPMAQHSRSTSAVRAR